MLLPAALSAILTAGNLAWFAAGVPSYSRQTRLACNVCHYGFPQLTPFGRLFKLNGYTMTGLTPITAPKDSNSRLQLQLSPVAPLSMMGVVSRTSTAASLPGTRPATTRFPQQLSLFAASAISPSIGIFSQVTYSQQSGTIGIDNTDLRFADHALIGDQDVLYGLTLHNNPTVQDAWNSTPAWGFPFVSAGVAPTPAAATVVEGALAQSVLGLGVYALFNDWIYAEVTGYVAAPQGFTLPSDSSATNTPKAVSPYWRIALQHDISGSTYLMVGTFGLSTGIFPSGVTGLTNHYNDVAFDAQLEQQIGTGMLIGRASYIHESQTLPAYYAAIPPTSQNPSNTLNTYKINLSYAPSTTHNVTVGYFNTSGSSDNLLFGAAPVSGSATGSPASQGEILEYTVNPWLNVRLGAQYTAYQKFNGGTTSYDILTGGRSAKNNNTLYLYLWFAY